MTYEEEVKIKEKGIAEVKVILKKHDIKMSVGGCGCCESPWVEFKYKGKWILKPGNGGCADFDMLDDKERYGKEGS